MASVKSMFSEALTKGMAAAANIPDSYNKAMAYAALAQAAAQTGLMTIAAETAMEVKGAEDKEVKEVPAKEEKAGKESLKAPAKGTGLKPAAPAKETPKEEPKQIEDTTEWTEEMVAKYKEDIDVVGKFREEYGDESINQCVEQFSEGTMKSVEDDITPLNIKAFRTFLETLASQQ